MGSRPNRCNANKYFDMYDHFPITAEWDIAIISAPIIKRKINLKKIESVKGQLISRKLFDLFEPIESTLINMLKN
ncbi:hypothetical protein AYI68_g7585 [Smittium mucronatum]|uniref:Uncharacterized protein n=1 Tax=Smittium mucronatum TaxID=133383 RepID=A0A1R0GNB1_9FUNG|nr:hypothetical protein AYI68_g7585 [Smittium mucronatum]